MQTNAIPPQVIQVLRHPTLAINKAIQAFTHGSSRCHEIEGIKTKVHEIGMTPLPWKSLLTSNGNSVSAKLSTSDKVEFQSMGHWTVANVGMMSLVALAATQWALTSTISFLIVFFGYFATSSLLEVVYYPPPSPRLQPKAENHQALTLFNVLMASLLAMVAAECHIRGLSYMDFNSLPSIWQIVGQVLLAFVFENTTEYYWHRFLHLRLPYAMIHKVHHHYKKPRPFDDMYMHPFEGFAYYCILYGPPFVFPMHLGSFVIYMIFMAVFGVMDHSGVPFHIKHIYNSTDHDVHHARFNYNYGFPFQYLDMVHGTYLSPSKAFKISS